MITGDISDTRYMTDDPTPETSTTSPTPKTSQTQKERQLHLN